MHRLGSADIGGRDHQVLARQPVEIAECALIAHTADLHDLCDEIAQRIAAVESKTTKQQVDVHMRRDVANLYVVYYLHCVPWVKPQYHPKRGNAPHRYACRALQVCVQLPEGHFRYAFERVQCPPERESVRPTAAEGDI